MSAPDPRGGRPNALPVLLPFALPEDRSAARLRPAHLWLLTALALVAVPAWAQGGTAALSPLEVVIKWAPLLLTGFAFNVAISLMAMAIGTVAGIGLGLAMLAEGRILVDGRPVSLADIRVPFFVVGTESDHVAPWRSVYKLLLLNDGDVTFVLTSGGHNAGIVSEPGHPHRHFRVREQLRGERYVGPDEWAEIAAKQEGSWWPVWGTWLDEHSGPPVAPPPMGAPARGYPPLEAAPGRYVFER